MTTNSVLSRSNRARLSAIFDRPPLISSACSIGYFTEGKTPPYMGLLTYAIRSVALIHCGTSISLWPYSFHLLPFTSYERSLIAACPTHYGAFYCFGEGNSCIQVLRDSATLEDVECTQLHADMYKAPFIVVVFSSLLRVFAIKCILNTMGNFSRKGLAKPRKLG